MELSLLAVAMALLGVFAGWLGSIVGIGGGLVIVPVLVLGFGFDIRVAVATSLVAVVATSTAAGSSYVGRGLANMRLGMTLEVAAAIGGIMGGLVAVLVSPSLLSGLFAVLMVATALTVVRGGRKPERVKAEGANSNRMPSRSGGRNRARSPTPTTTNTAASWCATGRTAWRSAPPPRWWRAPCRACSAWVAGS